MWVELDKNLGNPKLAANHYRMAASPEALGAIRQEISSPGPLHMSDLDMSPPGPVAPLPRKLEPLNPPKKKRKRAKKRETLASEHTSETLLGNSLRSQLRSRLDPIYNPTPPSQPSDDVTTPTNSEIEGHDREGTPRKEEEVRTDREEEQLPPSETPVDTVDEDEPAVGRQLPALPPDTEDPPQSTMADPLANGPPRDTPTNLQAYLSDEDVIDEGADGHMTHTLTLTHRHTHTTHNDVVYIERRDGRGFVAQKRGQVEASKGRDMGLAWTERDITSSQVTLFVHKIIQKLSITAHGLLAGLSLWDCVMTNVLAGQSDRHVGLLSVYFSLTLPIHAVYLFLLMIVTISLCDRLDLARIDKDCLRGFYRSPAQIFVLIAFILVSLALILTVSVAAIDERIALYPQLPSLWLDILDPVNASLSPLPAPTTHTSDSLVYTAISSPVSGLVTSWLGVVIVRVVLCCLSWLLAVWIAGTDRLEVIIILPSSLYFPNPDYLTGLSVDAGDLRKH